MTVCSGIGAPEQSAPWVEWRYSSEIERFPAAVLAARHPGTQNLGDMTKFKDWPDATVNVLAGGTPCQSFSVAGLRKGLADPRGNLALTFLAIADRYRPRWIVWENVPGVLSSNGGRDFGAFLGGLGQLGYGWAYRVLDAQYFGVPQRRRRVFVVGHSGGWAGAAAVLFERESLSGHPPPRRKAREGVAGRPDAGAAICSHDPACTLTAREYKGALPEADLSTVIAHTLRGEGSEDGTGRGVPLVPVAMPHAIRRLTPVECERLQGFPDDYTAIPWRGKPAAECPDGPRYKALGNSMAVPVMRWIFDRIRWVDEQTEAA